MVEYALPKWILLENFFMYAHPKIISKIALVFIYSDIFQKGKYSKITIWDKRCIMLYWIIEKKPIQVDSKALRQKPLEWANRCIIDGKVLKVTKKETANNISKSHTSHLSNKCRSFFLILPQHNLAKGWHWHLAHL